MPICRVSTTVDFAGSSTECAVPFARGIFVTYPFRGPRKNRPSTSHSTMLATTSNEFTLATPLGTQHPSALVRKLAQELEQLFETTFSIWNGETGTSLLGNGLNLFQDEGICAELVREVTRRHTPQFIGEAGTVTAFALPVTTTEQVPLVAVGCFAVGGVDGADSVEAEAGLLGLDVQSTRRWLDERELWSVNTIERMGGIFCEKLAAEVRCEHLSGEISSLSDNLSITYEEISLLCGITQKLNLERSDEEVGQLAVQWLLECVPASCCAIQYLPVAADGETTYSARSEPVLVMAGSCELAEATVTQLIDECAPAATLEPLVANRRRTSQTDWLFDEVHEVVIVPLRSSDVVFGWLAVINHVDGGEFGTVEANLLASLGVILGIHSGNRDLYRQQSEFLADVVRALTSAIDAKDPYTCGHSDRVARVSVRLGRELGEDEETLHRLYMAGLLHDIGKIGIDDAVLRKPGRLTEAEFEHIKLHPQLGYKILGDLKQLAAVLPVVLHHHEQWNGGGYPQGLSKEDIPLLARIAAVADAYDAMTSDRPYRKGMPHEAVEAIFRQGSGIQWDPRVIDAFFACRDDILDISRQERANLTLDVRQWT